LLVCVVISSDVLGCADHDQYDGFWCEMAASTPVVIALQLEGSPVIQSMNVACDQSILARDRPGSTNQVDIFISVYGDINTPEGNLKPFAASL
jgi:hypothetical protein